ncbi:hypothetical protein PIB30_088880 [Stylosanthes scabra]|uniref:Uncharacterized protein n=1 Tax=Stylosanthes scabra TaxID=79078 RepID=A0ABU6WS70_9FABA|nr:hypothetical protein [Stylosanthes scabra]
MIEVVGELVVLIPDYHSHPLPPPPPIPSTVPNWTPPPPPVDDFDPSGMSHPAGFEIHTSDTRNRSSRIITWIPARSADIIEHQDLDLARRFFSKNITCTQEITNIIKLMYGHHWPNWRAIPPAIRHRWYQKWAEKFTWISTHNATIKNIFDHRASERFSGMMEDVWE